LSRFFQSSFAQENMLHFLNYAAFLHPTQYLPFPPAPVRLCPSLPLWQVRSFLTMMWLTNLQRLFPRDVMLGCQTNTLTFPLLFLTRFCVPSLHPQLAFFFLCNTTPLLFSSCLGSADIMHLNSCHPEDVPILDFLLPFSPAPFVSYLLVDRPIDPFCLFFPMALSPFHFSGCRIGFFGSLLSRPRPWQLCPLLCCVFRSAAPSCRSPVRKLFWQPLLCVCNFSSPTDITFPFSDVTDGCVSTNFPRAHCHSFSLCLFRLV